MLLRLHQLAGDNTLLDGAESLVVDGGDTTVAGAANIQSSASYDASASDYTVSDTAGSILEAQGAVIDEGITDINVTNTVGAGVGVQLDILNDFSIDYGYSADVSFNVLDDANAIADALSPVSSIDFGSLTGVLSNEIQSTISKLYDGANNLLWDPQDRDYSSAVAASVITQEEANALITEESGSGTLNYEQLNTLNSILDALPGPQRLDYAENVQVIGGVVSVDSAADIQGVAGYDSGASSYTVSDTAGAILDATGTVIDDGVSTVNVDGPVGAGIGVELGQLDDASFETGYSADVNFNVVDDANDITAALSGDTTGAMDNAESLIASGGTATVAEAADIQGVAGYDSGASSYTVSDTAGAILDATGTVIDDGVSTVNVDGPVGAGIGVELGQLEDASFETGFSADVNFNVVDDANDITAALSGDTTGAMDNAESLIASGGTATVAEASDIQGVAGYDSGASSYTVSDTAGAILDATGTVIDDGVSAINVENTVGAGIGVELGQLDDASFETGFSADVNFNVVDDANDIAQALSAGTGTALDNAEDVQVVGGTAICR